MVDHVLALIDSVREHLTDQNIVVAVNRKSRESVCFAMDQTAGMYIFSHYGITVIQRIVHPADKKRFAEGLIRIAVQNPDADLGLFTPESGSKIGSLLREHIGETAVLKGSFCFLNLIFVNPGMTASYGTFLFFCNPH